MQAERGDKYKAENNQISIAEQSADHSWSLSSKLIAVEVQTEVVGVTKNKYISILITYIIRNIFRTKR